MQIAGFVVKCRKATVTGIFVGLATSGLALGASPSNVLVQGATTQDRLGAPPLTPAMLANATSSPGEAAASADKTIDGGVQVIAASRHAKPGIENPAQTFELAGSDIGMIHPRNNAGLETVATPAGSGSPRANGVTLWDEIVPPTPAPVPAGAEQPAPGSVASAAAK